MWDGNHLFFTIVNLILYKTWNCIISFEDKKSKFATKLTRLVLFNDNCNHWMYLLFAILPILLHMFKILKQAPICFRDSSQTARVCQSDPRMCIFTFFKDSGCDQMISVVDENEKERVQLVEHLVRGRNARRRSLNLEFLITCEWRETSCNNCTDKNL